MFPADILDPLNFKRQFLCFQLSFNKFHCVAAGGMMMGVLYILILSVVLCSSALNV